VDQHENPPHIVLLPGLHGSAALYGPLMSAIPGVYRRLIVEYPPHEPLGYDALLERIVALTAAIPRMVVIGDSFSGPLAVRLAAHAPDRVVAMVLTVTFIRCPLPRWFVGFSRLVGRISRPPRMQVRVQLTGWDAPCDLVDETQAAIAGAEKRVLAARIAAVQALDDAALLQQTRTPLLYLQAEFDRLIPPSNAALIQTLRPDATLIRLPAPHILLRVMPVETWQAIKQFVQQQADRTQ
jgi:pimeloyl-ACP methyl ester carboxylesterase